MDPQFVFGGIHRHFCEISGTLLNISAAFINTDCHTGRQHLADFVTHDTGWGFYVAFLFCPGNCISDRCPCSFFDCRGIGCHTGNGSTHQVRTNVIEPVVISQCCVFRFPDGTARRL